MSLARYADKIMREIKAELKQRAEAPRAQEDALAKLGKKPRTADPAKVRKFVRLVRAGASARQAALLAGIPTGSACYFLHREGLAGIMSARRAASRAIRDRLLERLLAGATLRQAADHVGLTLTQARDRIKDIT